MTQEQLTLFASVGLSLLMAYVPGARDYYDKMDAVGKSAVMAILLAVVVGGAFALSCLNLVSLGIVCAQKGFVDQVWLYVMALMANQGTYMLGVRPFKK